MIERDFAFRGNKAANKLSSFRDHGPGRDAAGTVRTERARAAASVRKTQHQHPERRRLTATSQRRLNVTALVTVDKAGLGPPAGRLPGSLMTEIDRGLRRVLGL
jgi:mRNA-degrading endonuclease toxin of MazEF toxin-antitoxin module